jgi:hypothetical protein
VHSLATEKDIDGFIALDVEMMRCEVFGGAFVMVKNQCRGMLNLCISDVSVITTSASQNCLVFSLTNYHVCVLITNSQQSPCCFKIPDSFRIY